MHGRLIFTLVTMILLSAFYPTPKTPAQGSVPGEDISHLLKNVFENNSWISLPEDQLEEFYNSIFVRDLAEKMLLETKEFRSCSQDWHHPARIAGVKLQSRTQKQTLLIVEIFWLSLDAGENRPSFKPQDREYYRVVVVETDHGPRVKGLTPVSEAEASSVTGPPTSQ